MNRYALIAVLALTAAAPVAAHATDPVTQTLSDAVNDAEKAARFYRAAAIAAVADRNGLLTRIDELTKLCGEKCAAEQTPPAPPPPAPQPAPEKKSKP